jgi:hypothetical protein
MTSFGSVGDSGMSDLEFRRELSPEQIREALSLLDSGAVAQNHQLPRADLNPAEQLDHPADQSSATMATPDRAPAAEDLPQLSEHLGLAAGFYGVAIVAAGVLALLLWRESALTLPPVLEISRTGGGSERQYSMPDGAGSSSVGYANRDDDRAGLKDAADSANAVASVLRSAKVPVTGTNSARSDDGVSRKPEPAWRHARPIRVAAATKRFWRRHWQARAKISGDKWCFFACAPWRVQRVQYEPPRTVTQ